MAGATLLLMRHLQTVWNAEGRFMSHTDLGLSANGINQAQERVGVTRASGADSIVSSPLLRCVQAANVVSGTFETTRFVQNSRAVEQVGTLGRA